MLLTIKQLQVKYGSRMALQIEEPLSFDKGERIGVIGSNGAGKSTLVKALLGLVDYQGSIITQIRPEQMAVHMQTNAYVNTMPVKRIMETILNTSIRENRELQELIGFFEFQDCLSKRFHALSGGQKQKLTIIMVMMQKAELTFYDEVTSGLDFESRQKLTEKLAEWYRDKENSLIIVSHYYEELEQLADKILLLDQGRVVAYGKVRELFRKYCGDAVYVLENTPENRRLAADFRELQSPDHLIALSCQDREEERRMLSLFVEHNMNFKRSSSDIEIMSINAKACFYGEDGARTA